MTIHSDWSRLLHQECPDAFTKQVPQGAALDIGVIDGHLQLMSLHHGLQSWERFVQYLFVKPIHALFAQGCPRVVLCFDCYAHVPVYKSITQQRRCSRMQEIKTFQAHWDLPSCIPSDPMPYLMNRNFKLKVIDRVLELLPTMVTLDRHQTLMVDYKTVVEYTAADQWIPRAVPDLVPLGESDIKFCRYVTQYGNAAVHAIDGDYIAIALLYYAEHQPGPKNRIFIYRQLAVLQETARKRPLDAAPCKKVMCWLDLQRIHDALGDILHGSGFEGSKAQATREAVFLMLCAGTDFSRGLPLLGPRRVWDMLPQITGGMVRGHESVEDYADGVVAALYALAYEKHTRRGGTLREVLDALRSSGLAKSTRERFPSERQVLVTLQNLKWVMLYWTSHNSKVETPTSGENGYTQHNKQIVFSDTLVAAPA